MLRSLKKDLSEMMEIAKLKQSSSYDLSRTALSNLVVAFRNGDVVNLPVLKLRPHQL